MINDVLEQITEDYFRFKGYFTQHNVKYRPSIKDPAYNVHSDVDMVAVHPKKKGIDRVCVVSCKSWHGGMQIERTLREIKQNKGKVRRTFREISMPVWSKALQAQIKKFTGSKNFVFYLVITKFKGNKDDWENFLFFKNNLKGCKIKLIDMETIVKEVWGTTSIITPAHSELSRLLQMINHSGGMLEYKNDI
jgi:hypothetical protein